MALRRTGEMSIGWLMNPGGSHRAGWMNYIDRADPFVDFSYYTQMAKEAERSLLDFIFHADWPSVRPGPHEQIARSTVYNNWLEPVPLMAALAAVTSRIGVVGTSSTSHCEPYNLARQFASIDHISGGRAGWNIVTTRSKAAAVNFGHLAEIPHAQRYREAEEFVDVVCGLWNSYEDDAFVRDPETGYYFDPEKLHVLNHEGEYFRVRGPLNIARPPQGYPVLFQAGASEDGIKLAARIGELVFCIMGTLEAMKAHYNKVREAATVFGRNPNELKIVCGLDVIVKESAAEAEDAFQQLQERLHPEAIKESVGNDIEADISDLGLDDLVTLDRLPKDANSSKSADSLIQSWIRERPMTVRELFYRFGRGRSALSVTGTPKEVADKMEEWFTAGAVDGYMLFLPLDSGMRDFGSLVVPELQRRGLFRTEYRGRTLRDHLGLPRPSFPTCRVRKKAG